MNSTIAQALASAMGLLSAFALFQLNTIGSECLAIVEITEAETGGGSNVRAMAATSNWVGVCNVLRRRLESHPEKAEMINARCNRIERLQIVHRAVLTALQACLALTAFSIATSIAVLAFVPDIAVTAYAQATLVFGFFLTTGCLGFYIWLVFVAFRGLD